MPEKKSSISVFTVAADLTGFLLNSLFWMFCGLVPAALIVVLVVQFQSAPVFAWVSVPVIVLCGLIARWFSKGLISRKKIRTLLTSLLLLAFSLLAAFGLVVTETVTKDPVAFYPTAVYLVLGFSLGVVLLAGLLTGKFRQESNANKGSD